MDLGSEMGSRESLISTYSKSTESLSTLQGGGAPQRPRDPRRKRETVPQEKSMLIDGKQINLNIYLPEKFHTTPYKRYTHQDWISIHS